MVLNFFFFFFFFFKCMASRKEIVQLPDSPDFKNLPDFRTGRDVRQSPSSAKQTTSADILLSWYIYCAPNTTDQCDEKCGFFDSRHVSEMTKSDGLHFTKVLRGILIPSVGILGFVGNVLSIIIFNRPEMKIWNFNGSYLMTKTSLIIISKKQFIKEKKKTYLTQLSYSLDHLK